MKIRELLESGYEFILYVDGKPISHYQDRFAANQDMRMLAKKHPNRNFELKQEQCKQVTVDTNESLTFMGSPCTKDCSGHKAGYKWSLDHNGAGAQTPSQSFNNGTTIAQAARMARPQGGGKIAQYTSNTPNAIRKRNARLQAQAATGVRQSASTPNNGTPNVQGNA